MGPRNHHTAPEGDPFCVLEWNIFCTKSANQAPNNSNGPCEDAGGDAARGVSVSTVNQPLY